MSFGGALAAARGRAASSFNWSRSGASVLVMAQLSSSGMTAVTSISTTHSGRASAGTTSPVEQG